MIRKRNIIFVLVLLFGIVSINYACALSVAVHVPEKYTDVAAGERFYFEIEVKYPENPQRKDLKLTYEILTQEGELIAQSKVLKAVETQASFVDFIVIPESADNGLHFLRVSIEDYEDLSENVETSFNVSNANFQIKAYFYVLIGLVLLVGVIITIEINRLKK